MNIRSCTLTQTITFAILALVTSVACPAPSYAGNGIDNPWIAEIDQSEKFDRILVISDIHGMYRETLLPLLKKQKVIDPFGRWTAGRTLVIICGDSIDKGSESLEVLNFWDSLSRSNEVRDSGGQIIHLLGNHEAEFLATPEKNRKNSDIYAELTARSIQSGHPNANVSLDGHSPEAKYMAAMPIAAVIGKQRKWLFAHSGYYPHKLKWDDFSKAVLNLLSVGNYGDKLVIGNDSILEAKDWWKDNGHSKKLADALLGMHFGGVVFGHQTSALKAKGQVGADVDNGIIRVKIDSGMAPVPEGLGTTGELLEISRPSDLNGANFPAMRALSLTGARTLTASH